MVELDRLWSIADEALAKACVLPWGPERIDALKAAARLRNEAANKERTHQRNGARRRSPFRLGVNSKRH